MVMLVAAGLLFAVAAGAIARAARPPRPCHYCGRVQPPRRLHPVELTDAGRVEVCAEVASCRKAAARASAR
jgi:hypothetical protein